MTEIRLFLLIFLSFSLNVSTTKTTIQLFSDDPDIISNTSQLVQFRGFRSELHYPITQDGYILTLIRLINPNYHHQQLRGPIYFQHGLFGNSDDFILSKHEVLTSNGLLNLNNQQVTNCTGSDPMAIGQSLAYVLSSCGYDVWLGNFRGNRYSTGHVLLNSKTDRDYWQFNVDHLSRYDLTANINYILHHTKSSQLGYVGHSLGTSVMFQLLSTQPEYSKNIKPAIMLAPVAHVSHIRAPLLLLASYNKPFINWLSTTNMPIFGLPSHLLTILDQLIGTFICGNSLFRPLCTVFLFTLCGFDYPNTNQSIIPFAYGHFPDNTATQVLAHLGQRVVRNTFNFFDYGPVENMRRYQVPQTPVYNLSRIDNQYLILISGINDWLADPDDVDIIRSQLQVKLYKDYVIPYDLFNHADFLFGNNVGQFQNSMVLKWLNELYDQ